MYLKALVLYLLTWINATAAYRPRTIIELMQANTSGGNRSSIVFPIVGNVYPLRYYKVAISIGDPPKLYFLDMDTGSDLTWLQCDTPCYHCSKGPNGTLYKHIGNPLICAEPVCDRSLQRPESPCQGPDEQCDYEVAYTDHGASIGVLVRDSVHLNMTNGAMVAPQLAFGLGTFHLLLFLCWFRHFNLGMFSKSLCRLNVTRWCLTLVNSSDQALN
ncbi:NEDD8-activating protein uba3 [Orobanche hederae]